jgi:hypothetical protein
LPKSDEPTNQRVNASAECWSLYGELTGYTVMLGDLTFIHQHFVDTYQAQHPGAPTKPIAVAFGLIGLYLACEKDYTGRQVQHMHMLLANRSKIWPSFTPPAHLGALTIRDALQSPPGAMRDAAIMRWAASVWDAWRAEHERVKSLIAAVMDK